MFVTWRMASSATRLAATTPKASRSAARSTSRRVFPINNLYAHPAYQNAGEVPFCADDTTNCASARGSLGRTSNFGSVDGHLGLSHPHLRREALRLIADLFNISNQRTQLRVDQQRQTRFGVGNADFLKPNRNRSFRCQRQHEPWLPASVSMPLRRKNSNSRIARVLFQGRASCPPCFYFL